MSTSRPTTSAWPGLATWYERWRESWHPLLALAVLCIAVSGCTTTPGEPRVAENEEITQAETDLGEAEMRGAVWLVRDSAFNGALVSLEKLLDRAISLRDAGDQAAASEIASRVSRYARLGIAQADDQVGAAPYYPQ